ncbi:radical SAM protein [Streptomyces wedmorensis]
MSGAGPRAIDRGKDLIVGLQTDAPLKRAITPYGGGATISGGEPLLQPVFTGELLHRMKHELGLHAALDTSGFLGVHATDALLRDTDLVLLDIKSWDPDTYEKVTGRPPAPTLDFARRLAGLGQEVHVRFVLVPGLTDGPADVEGVAAFAAGLGNVSRVDILPFHKLGEAKWQALAMPFTLHGTPVPHPRAGRRGPRGLPGPWPARRLSDALTQELHKTGKRDRMALP